ncbi:hypothetical protein E2C01_011721 [Portunus trituberculatus]|uniref:Uncharacterized protein n=1 Tax=Portunus trituberculatus TaxID=210409 RepID=A0A5B7DC91_PORTR|nr:hypothetical protein [Portunus trituberculatus]
MYSRQTLWLAGTRGLVQAGRSLMQPSQRTRLPTPSGNALVPSYSSSPVPSPACSPFIHFICRRSCAVSVFDKDQLSGSAIRAISGALSASTSQPCGRGVTEGRGVKKNRETDRSEGGGKGGGETGTAGRRTGDARGGSDRHRLVIRGRPRHELESDARGMRIKDVIGPRAVSTSCCAGGGLGERFKYFCRPYLPVWASGSTAKRSIWRYIWGLTFDSPIASNWKKPISGEEKLVLTISALLCDALLGISPCSIPVIRVPSKNVHRIPYSRALCDSDLRQR